MRKHQITPNRKALFGYTLQKCQDNERQGKTKEQFQTEGDPRARSAKPTHHPGLRTYKGHQRQLWYAWDLWIGW